MTKGFCGAFEDFRVAQRFHGLRDDQPEGKKVIALQHLQILLNAIAERRAGQGGDVDQFVPDNVDGSDEVRRCGLTGEDRSDI